MRRQRLWKPPDSGLLLLPKASPRGCPHFLGYCGHPHSSQNGSAPPALQARLCTRPLGWQPQSLRGSSEEQV